MDSPKDLPEWPPEVRILSNKEDVAICGVLRGSVAAIQQAHANHLIAALRARLELVLSELEAAADILVENGDWPAYDKISDIVHVCREPDHG